MTATVRVQMPKKLLWAFAGDARYRGAHGGRGSGKSFNFAKMAAIKGYQNPLRILCCREIQKSIKESSMAEVAAAIESESWLAEFYEIGENYIRGENGTEFLFSGLWRNVKAVKSMHGIDIAWVEEAEAVSDKSWRTLTPTIRKPGSEIWLTWNPEASDSATNKRFIQNPPPRSRIVALNYDQNPWFTEELEEERQADLKRDPDLYRHIWLGETITRTDAQIFNKRWRVEAFDDALADKAERIYFGADFGFAADPSTLVRFFILSNKLFIQYEAYGHGIELDEMAAFYDTVPGSRKWPIKGDGSRPETISHMRRRGFNIEPADKWPGCIEDGIMHIKGYDEIVIHERCVYTAEEFQKYSYKVDPQTDDVLPIVVDKWNHCIARGETVETARGHIAIENVVPGDHVRTRGGWDRVQRAWLAQRGAPLWEVRTANGLSVRGTPDHEVWTEDRGMTRMDALRYDDVLTTRQPVSCNTTANAGPVNRAGTINGKRTRHPYTCIVTCMSSITARFLTAMKCITSTANGTTTAPATSKHCQSKSMSSGIRGQNTGKSTAESTLRAYDRSPRKGTERQNLALKNQGTRKCSGSLRNGIRLRASNVTLLIQRLFPAAPSFAATHAKPAICERDDEPSAIAFVGPVDARADVYDLTVERNHEFFANGILVSNCMDAIRYGHDGLIQASDDMALWRRLAQ